MCLAGAVVSSWSLTQEVAGMNPFTVMTHIFVIESNENIEEKLNCTTFFIVNCYIQIIHCTKPISGCVRITQK